MIARRLSPVTFQLKLPTAPKLPTITAVLVEVGIPILR